MKGDRPDYFEFKQVIKYLGGVREGGQLGRREEAVQYFTMKKAILYD